VEAGTFTERRVLLEFWPYDTAWIRVEVRLAVKPVGMASVRVTSPLKLLKPNTLMVEVAELPCETVMVGWKAVTTKSGVVCAAILHAVNG
jgi:hypothetical protein